MSKMPTSDHDVPGQDKSKAPNRSMASRQGPTNVPQISIIANVCCALNMALHLHLLFESVFILYLGRSNDEDTPTVGENFPA